MKRICLFAGYNYSNIVSNYVLDYLNELSKYADIYYLADGSLPDKELDKVRKLTKGAWVENHHGYDFFSWKLLVNKYVGWKNIKNYDELIFVNDSCFCVNSFAPVFNKMDTKRYIDIWGLSAADNMNISEVSSFKEYVKKGKNHFFIGSYFWGVRKKFFNNKSFRKFINDIEISKDRNDVYTKYELGIMRLAIKLKAKMDVFDEMVWRYSTSYMRDAFNLLKNGYPLLKVRIFIDNIGGATLMNELALKTRPFVHYDYIQYIEQVRAERNVNIETLKKQDRLSIKKIRLSINKLKKYIFPPLILDLFRSRKIKKFFTENLKKIYLYITPPFMVDIIIFISHIGRRKSCDNHSFSHLPRPKYGGYYPCHIKDYDKIQKGRIKRIEGTQSLVIFFNVMREAISGGMLSIDRFVNHSIPISKSNNFVVVQSNLPLTNACITNPFFDYSSEPIDFNYIVKYTKPKKLIINIPECFIPSFLEEISEEQYLWLWSIPKLCINILNQSDELMPDQGSIEELRTLCNNNLTMTAAHQRYCTEEKSKQYNCPIFLLTPFLPEFIRTPFEQKEKIIVLSPDENEYKQKVIDKLRAELPDYKIVFVEKMKLEDYKKLISKAMYTITFGEGYDGYFIEPYLSDSISFSIRNTKFYPKNFADVPTVYDTWDELIQNITIDIRKYEQDKVLYERISKLVEKEIQKYTNNNQSNLDLNNYYKRFLRL